MTTGDENSKSRFRLRWWHVLTAGIVVVVVGLYVTGLVLRHQGKADYQRIVDTEHAAGRPGTVDEYIDSMPPIDGVLMKKYEAWFHSFKNFPSQAFDDTMWNLWMLGMGSRPDSTWIDDQKEYMEKGLLLLRNEKSIPLNNTSWIAGSFPPGHRNLKDFEYRYRHSYRAIEFISQWLRHHAAISDNPKQDLSDLQRLFRAFTDVPCSDLTDMYFVYCVDRIRARTFLDLALLGHLDPEVRDAWLAEPRYERGLMMKALLGERLVNYDVAMRSLDPNDPWPQRDLFGHTFEHSYSNIYNDVIEGRFSSASEEFFQAAIGRPFLWVIGCRNFAYAAQCEVALRARLNQENTAPIDWHLLQSNAGLLSKSALWRLSSAIHRYAIHEAFLRANRLAVRLLSMPSLPIDQAALIACLGNIAALTPGGDRLSLTYQYLAPGSFRIAADLIEQTPNFFDSSVAASLPPTPLTPIVWDFKSGIIEIQRPNPESPLTHDD